MPENPPFEVPASVRELAERNVEQARTAYTQFLDFARQAQEAMTKSSVAMATGAREVQSRAMRYAGDNVEAGFALASDLAKARDLKEFLEIQQRYAQQQLRTYTEQAQEIGRLLADTAQRAQKSQLSTSKGKSL
jgi:phasin